MCTNFSALSIIFRMAVKSSVLPFAIRLLGDAAINISYNVLSKLL